MPKNVSKKGVSQENLQKRESEKETRFHGKFKPYLIDMEAFVPRDGENKIRIIQPIEVDDLGYYGFDVSFHRNVGLNKDYFLCLKEMAEQPCPICAAQTSELWDEDKDLAKTYYPDRRVLFFVLDLLSKEPGLLRLWSCPMTLSDEILGQSRKKGTEVYIDVSHPDTGTAVYFDRFGKGRNTKYKNVQVSDEVIKADDEIYEARISFADCLIVPSYEEVDASFKILQPDMGESPPVSAYEDDARAAGGDVEEEEVEPEAEPEEEEDQFNDMDRTELKKFKVKMKQEYPEPFGFTIFKTTTDDEIREGLRDAMKAIEPEPEVEEEEETKPVQRVRASDADDDKAKKREDTKAEIKAKIRGKRG